MNAQENLFYPSSTAWNFTPFPPTRHTLRNGKNRSVAGKDTRESSRIMNHGFSRKNPDKYMR